MSESVGMTDLIIIALATLYLAHAFVNTHGPFHAFERLRNWRDGRWHGGLLSCTTCAAIWIAALMYVLLPTPLAPVVYISAAAGGAVALTAYSGVAHL